MPTDRTDKPDKLNNLEEVTLTMRMEDVIGLVSKSGNTSMISGNSLHDDEAEDLKKAWFRHMLSSMEKLNGLIETVRSVEMSNLRNDLKDEIRKVESRLDKIEQQARDNRQELIQKAEKIDANLRAKIDTAYRDLLKRIDEVDKDLQNYKLAVDKKFSDAEKDLNDYKKTVVDPLRMKLLSISIKLGVWAAIAGAAGSVLFTVGFALFKVYVLNTTP